jgi:hypothetical protein
VWCALQSGCGGQHFLLALGLGLNLCQPLLGGWCAEDAIRCCWFVWGSTAANLMGAGVTAALLILLGLTFSMFT